MKKILLATLTLSASMIAMAGNNSHTGDVTLQNSTDATVSVSEKSLSDQTKPNIPKIKDKINNMPNKKRNNQPVKVGNPAPNFTLKNLDGNNVSLSDFRGKWVILDFWGSWCPWCIKGFPALKEAYKEYKGKVEIIGIDCGDTYQGWKDAVKEYNLPWVHVYNPEGSSLTSNYRIEGYPTKFIIDPKGKIAAIVVGEDPEFFVTLRQLVK